MTKARIVFSNIPVQDKIKNNLVQSPPPVLPIFPPKGILGNDPEIVGEATSIDFAIPESFSHLFIVGPNTAKDANPVPKARVPIHNAC